MTTKYTPGPLVVLVHAARGCWYVRKEVKPGSFNQRDWDIFACISSSEADALLFAAAPDMYEALPDLSHVITWLQNGCDPIKAANELQVYQERIDRAKAKAEGRT